MALGTQIHLSRALTQREWGMVYDMAKKQSMIGVCFAGVQRLPESERPQEMLYLTWMGMAAKIQQKNAIADTECKELWQLIGGEGFPCVVFKGQSFATEYGRLSGLRQVGDIDLWIKANETTIMNW